MTPAVIGAVVVLSVVVGLVVGGVFSSSSSPAGHTAVAGVQVKVHQSATAGVAFALGSGWVLDDNAGTIRRFDPTSGRFTGTAVHIGTRPVAVVEADNRLWMADAVANDVVVFNPSTSKVDGAPIPVGPEPVSIAAGDGGVWVASINAGNAGVVSLIDTTTRAVTASVSPPDGAVRVATGPGAVWVTGLTDTVARIDPTPQGSTLRYQVTTVDTVPIGVVAAGQFAYVGNTASGTISVLDATTGSVIRTITLHDGAVADVVSGPGTTTTSSPTAVPPSDPGVLAVFDGHLWVGDGQNGDVSELDLVTGASAGAPAHLGGVPRSFTVDGGALWVAQANPGAVVEITPN